MPVCKFCGEPFAWGNNDGGWVPLVPAGDEGELKRDYQDESGALRASHAQVCTRVGGPAVRVVKLAKAVEAKDVLPQSIAPGQPEPFTIKRKRGRPRKNP